MGLPAAVSGRGALLSPTCFWAFFVLLGGLRHAPPMNDITGLNRPRKGPGGVIPLCCFSAVVPDPERWGWIPAGGLGGGLQTTKLGLQNSLDIMTRTFRRLVLERRLHQRRVPGFEVPQRPLPFSCFLVAFCIIPMSCDKSALVTFRLLRNNQSNPGETTAEFQ